MFVGDTARNWVCFVNCCDAVGVAVGAEVDADAVPERGRSVEIPFHRRGGVTGAYGDFQEAGIGVVGGFQMYDIDRLCQVFEERSEELCRGDGRVGFDRSGIVEPDQRRFGCGVAFVVQIQAVLPGGKRAAKYFVEPFGDTLPCYRAQSTGIRKSGGVLEIGLGDADYVGFGELLFEEEKGVRVG